MRLLFVGTSLLAIVSCRQDNRQAPADDVISVTAEVVRPDSGDSRFIVSGDIEGQKTVKTAFQVAGRISGTVGEEGCMVRKGETIAWLDPTNYAIAKELADIMVAQAADEYSRVSILHERNSVSESDFMKCKYALDNAKGQQKLRAKDLADTRLQAPIGGILLQKMGETGEMAAAGMPVAVISDISRVKINAYIPENRLRDIKIGQPVEVRIDAIGAVRKGSISEVGGMADPASRAFTVKAIVENADYAIRPGMIAEVTFSIADDRKVITVGSSALLRTPDGQPYVYVADKERGQAFRREVALGAVRGSRIEVSSGLAAGETVVTGGAGKLSNGSRINIRK